MKSLLSFLFAGFLVVGLLGGCAKDEPEYPDFSKLIGAADIKAEPRPLEAIGGKVPVTITVTFPAGFVYPDATLKLQPILVYGGVESRGQEFAFRGEQVEGKEEKLPFKEESYATLKAYYTYMPAMKDASKLYLQFTVNFRNRQTIFRIEIGEGVISTS